MHFTGLSCTEGRMSERILVTGSTDGIGLETALILAKRGHAVILHGRNEAKLKAATEQLKQVSQVPVPVGEIGDLSSLADVRRLAASILKRPDAPTVLLNNAGTFQTERHLSVDGFEMTMAINHLGPALLTLLLLEGKAPLTRIVNVSSMAHARGRIDVDDVTGTHTEFNGYAHYATSKLANVLFTVALAPRVKARGITVNALHPGVVTTKLLKTGFNMNGHESLAEGSATSVMLAVDEAGAKTTGEYFSHQKLAPMNPVAKKPEVVEAFFQNTLKAIGLSDLPQ